MLGLDFDIKNSGIARLKTVTLAFVIVVFGFIFNSCKKYPENRLWFRKPENTFRGGRITAFTVDGDDSLTLVNSTWASDISTKTFNLYKPYHDNSWWDAQGDFEGIFIFHGDKEISFGLSRPFDYYAVVQPPIPVYLPFNSLGISEGKTDGRWDIIKCTKKNS